MARSLAVGDGHRWLGVIVWLYALLVLGLVLLLRLTGDRLWITTFLLFGPRWLLVLPLPILVAAVLILRRRLLWLLLLTALLLVGPFLGFSLPLRSWMVRDGQRLRVLTCNLMASGEPAERIVSLAGELRPDIVAVQEWKSEAAAWPDDWHVISEGELLIASQHPILQHGSYLGEHPPHAYPRVSALHCLIRTPHGPLAFSNVHLPSARYGISEILDRETIIDPGKRSTLRVETANRDALSREIADLVRGMSRDAVVAGDFNMPIESAIYRRDWSGYGNAFSRAGTGLGWTYRMKIRGCPFGVRIDHVLTGRGWNARRAWVERDVGSDHRPLVADLVRIGGP